ncbi:MAG TPA: YjbH domain-containing protein, partial [Armatimonadota bacterium]|nr:YjbH domain-containing protein [Armatimonadota bacterium]
AGGSAFNSFGVQFGVTSRFELGATYLDSDDFRGDSGLLVNAKFALLKESLAWPQISVGVTDVFDQTGLDPSWYAVASKGLVLGLRAHAGYGGGVYNDRPFFGLEWDMGSNPKLGLIGEYVDRDVNLGIRARVGGFSGTVGVFDFDEWGFSISYTGGLRL